MNRRLPVKNGVPGGVGKGSHRSKAQSERKKSVPVEPCGANAKKDGMKRKFALKKTVIPTAPKDYSEEGEKKYKTYYVSSTPLNTPLKVEKLRNGGMADDIETLSDISKTSSSSVCSSVSSGLIELLCNYNAASLRNNRTNEDVGSQEMENSGGVDLDKTPTAETLYSFVTLTEAGNCVGRLKILAELMTKLRTTVSSILSSGDSRSMKRMEKITEIMEKELSILQEDLPKILDENRNVGARIEEITGPLRSENAAVQRKLRIANQNLTECERRLNENDINLELQTVKCMNDTLMEQVKMLSANVQQLQESKKTQESLIDQLKKDNAKLHNDMSSKDMAFSKSQELFSTEAGTIKSEVANALKKVDTLKRELCEAETECELAKANLQGKDEEIARLNDLNKGLQSSVARLLEDLKKASQSRNVLKPPGDVSSAFLKNLQTLLNHPPSRIPPSTNHQALKHGGGVPFMYHTSPVLSLNNEASALYGPGSDGCADNFLPTNHDDVLESSRLSSIQADTPPTEPLSTIETRFKNMAPFQGTAYPGVNGSLPSWEPSSVSSSFISFTSRDENDFANGLAVLDADIQRLQDSLHEMSATKT